MDDSSYERRCIQIEPTTAYLFRCQGQYEDQETRLYYNRFRYYDPEISTYSGQDLIRLTGGKRPYGYTTKPSTHIAH